MLTLTASGDVSDYSDTSSLQQAIASAAATLALAATAKPATATLPACNASGRPSGAATAAERAAAVASTA